MDKTIRSTYGNLSSDIACAILGAGVANNEMRSAKMLPWDNEPAKNISPFFLFADHGELMRERTREVVAKPRLTMLSRRWRAELTHLAFRRRLRSSFSLR